MSPTFFEKITEVKSSLSNKQKQKLIVGLKEWKSKKFANSKNQKKEMLSEDKSTERDVIAKTFIDNGDFDTYVNKNRGIQFSPKELDTISNFKKVVAPTSMDKFFVRFETTDDFGNNTTTVVKKFRQGNQFVFSSFTKNDNSIQEPDEPEEAEAPEAPPMGAKKQPNPADKQQMPAAPKPQMPQTNQKPGVGMKPPLKEGDEQSSNNKITITKTITFLDEITGADVLSDFLRKLDL
jgi:hypothetical protein